MKSRSTKPAFKLPVAWQDLSSEIDRSLELIGRLAEAAGSDDHVDARLVSEIGSAINSYLKKRNGLEFILGRCALHSDDEFLETVATFKRRIEVKS